MAMSEPKRPQNMFNSSGNDSHNPLFLVPGHKKSNSQSDILERVNETKG